MHEANTSRTFDDQPVPTIDQGPDPPPTAGEPSASSRRATTVEGARPSTGRLWLAWGPLSGFLAGAAFMALHCWFAVTTGNGALLPFRTVATIVQGSPAEPAPVWLGMVVHSVLAAVLGLLFVALLLPLRRRSAGWLQWAGLLYGAAIYIVGFQVLARAVPGLSALLEGPNQPFELAAHLVFGAVLAALVLLAKPARR